MSSPRNVAQAFADHLNAVLNRTVSDARLTLVPNPGREEHFTIACLDGSRPVSFALHGSYLRLLVSHTVDVDGEKCHTASYAYRLVASEAKDAWLVRWEYLRQLPRPEYEYPLAHVHVNGSFTDSAVEPLKPMPSLHIPTARVPFEMVLWHVIAEWNVQSKTDDWRAILEESLAGYERRRTVP